MAEMLSLTKNNKSVDIKTLLQVSREGRKIANELGSWIRLLRR
jgi:hypothetical protein